MSSGDFGGLERLRKTLPFYLIMMIAYFHLNISLFPIISFSTYAGNFLPDAKLTMNRLLL